MKNLRKIIKILCLLFGSCTTVVENGGRVLDGSAFAENPRRVYQSLAAADGVTIRYIESGGKDPRPYLVVTLDGLPELEFRGTLPNQNGAFIVESLHFIGGSLSGWNEFTLDLIGSGSFTLNGDMGELKINIADTGTISAGKIRHKGDRITGSQAVTSLLNRRQRITALADWMRGRADTAPAFADRKGFYGYWKTVLLPELVAPQNRPPAFSQEPKWAAAGDIRWNTTYTALLFPEELRELRNSGALLRDWEEAPAWIYMQYQWKDITARMSEGYTVLKIK